MQLIVIVLLLDMDMDVIAIKILNYSLKSPKLRDFFDEEYCFEKKQQNYNQFYIEN
jgi:flagellar biosynthesis protein FliR